MFRNGLGPSQKLWFFLDFWLTQPPEVDFSLFWLPPKKILFFWEKEGLRIVQFSEKIDKKNCFFWPQKMIFFWALGDFFGAWPEKRAQHIKKCQQWSNSTTKLIYNFSSFLPLYMLASQWSVTLACREGEMYLTNLGTPPPKWKYKR